MEDTIVDNRQLSNSRDKKDAAEKETEKMKRKSESISRWEGEGGNVLPTEELPQGQQTQTPVKQPLDNQSGK